MTSSARAMTISRWPGIGEILSSREMFRIRHASSIFVVVALPSTIFVSRAMRAITRNMTFCGALFKRSRRKRMKAGLLSETIVLLGFLFPPKALRAGSGILIWQGFELGKIVVAQYIDAKRSRQGKGDFRRTVCQRGIAVTRIARFDGCFVGLWAIHSRFRSAVKPWTTAIA